MMEFAKLGMPLPPELMDKSVFDQLRKPSMITLVERRWKIHAQWFAQMQHKLAGTVHEVPLELAGALNEPVTRMLVEQLKLGITGVGKKFVPWEVVAPTLVQEIRDVAGEWIGHKELTRAAPEYGLWLQGLIQASQATTSHTLRLADAQMLKSTKRLYRRGRLTPVFVVGDYNCNPDPRPRARLLLGEAELTWGIPQINGNRQVFRYIDLLLNEFEPNWKRSYCAKLIMEYVCGGGWPIFSIASGQAITGGIMVFTNAFEVVVPLERMYKSMGWPVEEVAQLVLWYMYAHERGHNMYTKLKAILDEFGGDMPAIYAITKLLDNEPEKQVRLLLLIETLLAWQASVAHKDEANEDSYRRVGQEVLHMTLNRDPEEVIGRVVKFRDKYLRTNKVPRDYLTNMEREFCEWAVLALSQEAK